MVDHGRKRGGVRQAYAAELGKTRILRRLFETSRIEIEPWACDASIYNVSRYAGDGWLLAGDAASTVDPLSSFGVKKALISAWMGAVVVNTCLSRPQMAEEALRFYNLREQQTWTDHTRQASFQFAELTTRFPTPFWQSRSRVPQDLQLYDPAKLQRAHEQLRSASEIRLRLTSPLRDSRIPAIAGREIVMLDRLTIPGVPPTVEYVQGVNLIQLARMAADHNQVRDLYAAYTEASSFVALPNFLSALSFLIASGVLENTAAL